MAETIGTTVCPECGKDAELRQDNRKKLFVTCTDCGRFLYNTNTGQERLRAKVAREQQPEAEQVIESVVMPVVDEPEPEIITNPAPQPSKSGQGNGGAIALGVGVLLGVITWTLKKKPTNTTTNVKANQPGMM